MSIAPIAVRPAAAPANIGVSRPIDTKRAVLILIAVGIVVRMAMAAVLGLGTDESYTVGNSRFIAWSYVDYPPLHVWLVGAWAWLCGSDNHFIVRLPFIAVFAGATWIMFRLGALLFGERAGVWAAVLFNLAPVFALPHGSWVLPDGPLALFMLSAGYGAARLLFGKPEPSRDILGWLGVGIFTGLALLTKYHGAFLPAGLLVFLLTWKPGRPLLAAAGPWLGVALAVAIFLPVIVWNMQHDWIGLSFQAKRIPGANHLSLARVASNIAAQAGYLAPWLFLPLAYVLLRALKRGPADAPAWFLALLAVGPIVFFTGATLFARGLPHWSMPGWLFAFPLLGAEAAKLESLRPKLMRGAAQASAAILIVLLAIAGSQAATGWLSLGSSDPTLELLDWTGAKTALAQRGLLGPGTAALATSSWIEAGKLNYAVGREVPVLCLCADPQEFRFLHDPGSFAGRDILIVEEVGRQKRHSAALAKWFSSVQALPPITLYRAGRPALELAVSRGIGFRP